jgi:hypothetical protein
LRLDEIAALGDNPAGLKVFATRTPGMAKV